MYEVQVNRIGCLVHSTGIMVWLFCCKSLVEGVVCELGLEGWLQFPKVKLAGRTLRAERKLLSTGWVLCCKCVSHGPHLSRLQGTEVAGMATWLLGSQEGLSQPAWAAATELQSMVALQEPGPGWADDCFSKAARYLNFYGKCSDFKS